MRSSTPLCYLIERGPGRGSLDRALLDQALALEVDVRFGSRKERLESPGIFALGPRSATAIAVGYHFETHQEDGFWIILDDALAPAGYAYLLVMGGRGTVKTCIFKNFSRRRTYVERTVERFRRLLGFDIRDARFHGGVGNFFVPTTARRGQHAIAGEQAGFQDALADFGMRYASQSGVMAAQCLLEDPDYEASWQQQMRGQIETAWVNRAIYERRLTHEGATQSDMASDKCRRRSCHAASHMSPDQSRGHRHYSDFLTQTKEKMTNKDHTKATPRKRDDRDPVCGKHYVR